MVWQQDHYPSLSTPPLAAELRTNGSGRDAHGRSAPPSVTGVSCAQDVTERRCQHRFRRRNFRTLHLAREPIAGRGLCQVTWPIISGRMHRVVVTPSDRIRPSGEGPGTRQHGLSPRRSERPPLDLFGGRVTSHWGGEPNASPGIPQSGEPGSPSGTGIWSGRRPTRPDLPARPTDWQLGGSAVPPAARRPRG